MRNGPNIAAVAALIGEPGRATILTALMNGRALSAGELASQAGLSAAAASAQLAKLLEGGMLVCEQQGRHRYYRLASQDVAGVIENLAFLGQALPQPRHTVTRANPLSYARTCYDHVAGELGVAIAEALERNLLLVPDGGKRLKVTASGSAWFADALGLDVSALKPGRQGIVCHCLDWTERRNHLAGPLGSHILRKACDLGFLVRTPHSRRLDLTARGRKFFHTRMGVKLRTQQPQGSGK
jgi:DNA-binding transcriptional ArsR family regulator